MTKEERVEIEIEISDLENQIADLENQIAELEKMLERESEDKE